MKYWYEEDIREISQVLLEGTLTKGQAIEFGERLGEILVEMAPSGLNDKVGAVKSHVFNATKKYYQILMMPYESKNKWKSNLKNNILKFMVRDNKHGKSIVLVWDELNEILEIERRAAFEEAQEKLKKNAPFLSKKTVDDYDKFTVQDIFNFTGKGLPDWKNKNMKYRYNN